MDTCTAIELTQQMRADITGAFLDNYELIIRDMAGTVISLCNSRRDHPSYGTTKGIILKAYNRLDGVIGAYMVLAGQAAHTSVPVLAEFRDQATTDLVHEARGRCIMAGVKV